MISDPLTFVLNRHEVGTFTCISCGGVFSLANRYRKSFKCRPCYKICCQKWREQNKEKVRAYSREWQRANPVQAHKHKLKNRYNMTVGEYERLLHDQGGVCAICRGREVKLDRFGKVQQLSVDHCHATGRNRALLCDFCNKGLGMFKDNPALLRSAADYLNQHKH